MTPTVRLATSEGAALPLLWSHAPARVLASTVDKTLEVQIDG